MREHEEPAGPAATIAIDGGDLPLGGGLLALVRPALDGLAPGGLLAIVSSARALDEDLAVWCKVERHRYLGAAPIGDANEGRTRHLLARGDHPGPRAMDDVPSSVAPLTPAPGDGALRAADLLAAVPFPARTDARSGLAPRGARVEPGGPAWPFRLTDRDHAAPDEIAQLYDQAVSSQWDATRDIPWARHRALPAPLEAAVAQLMFFLAENELSALYVPSRFVARIHPAYAETAMFLATQMADEARHIDAFLKRARLGGGPPGVSAVVTSRSLQSLLQTDDFCEAAFLLGVLGEGTFLDLLRFIEEHAPDEVTAEVVRRARADEARHVRFALCHVRHALAADPTLFSRLQAAVRRRAANLAGAGGVPPAVADALTILAARGTDPPSVRRGHEAVRALYDVMHEGRVKRLQSAGFTIDQADLLSGLHTPNFM